MMRIRLEIVMQKEILNRNLMIHLQRGERVMEMKWFMDLFPGLGKKMRI
jgi:hypothetical protein